MRIRKRVMAFLLAVIMVLGMVPTATLPVQAANVDIDLGEVEWSTDYSTYSFPDASVDFDNAKQKIFCLSVNNAGSFVVPNTLNLGTGCKIKGIEITDAGKVYQDSVTGGMELSSITVIGRDITQEQIADFIRALLFKRNVTDKKTEQTVSVAANEVELDDDETAMAVDGVIHYYKYILFDDAVKDDGEDYIKGSQTWYDAYNSAKSTVFQGMNGYLATLSEDNEQIFIFGALGGRLQAWLGGARTYMDNLVYDASIIRDGALNPGTDGNIVRDFAWMCGPEAGKVFFRTNENGNNWGGAEYIEGTYTCWNPEYTEPNNAYQAVTSRIEDPYNQEYVLEYGFNEYGYWNDYSPYNVMREEGSGILGYLVEFSPYILSGDGKNPTEEKEAVPSSTDIQIIVANDIKMKTKDFIVSTTDAQTMTDAIAKEKAEITVTETGIPVPDADAKSRITVDQEDLAEVKTGETGRYNVTYVYSSENGSVSDKATVRVVDVTDVSNDGNVIIGANNFNITLKQAELICSNPDDPDVQAMIKALANAVATDDDKTDGKVDTKDISVDATDVQVANGSYDVTFSYGGQTVTVQATVKNDDDTDKTDVPGISLTANDFTVEAGSTVLTAADFNKKAEVVAKKNDGTAAVATPNAADLAKLNEAIKNCTEGTYDVKVSSGSKTVVVTVTVTKADDTTGVDKLFEISNPKDVTQDLDKGRKVSKVTVDGTDITGNKYKVDGDILVVDDSVFQKKKADTTSTVVITYSDGSKKTFKVKIVSYDKENVVTKVPVFHMQKDIGVKKTFKLNLVGMNKYSVKKFKSSNKNIATINKDGVIKAKKVGKCKITATVIQNGSYYTVKIDLHVKKNIKMYNLKKKALQKKQGVLPEFNVYKRVVKGKTTKLKFTNVTKDAKITYKSSNKRIASVSKKGVIKGKKKGFCVITAKIQQNGFTYYTKLIVRVDDGTKNKQLKKYLK